VLIALTGRGSARDVHQARVAGFDEHVRKPAEPERLMALVKNSTTELNHDRANATADE
jgi:CheY-like chemotaxis protein